jgi:hypothetical protein
MDITQKKIKNPIDTFLIKEYGVTTERIAFMRTEKPRDKKPQFKRTDPHMKGTIKDLLVAEGKLNGLEPSEISKDVSRRLKKKVSTKEVNKILSKKEVNEIIDAQYSKMVKALPVATENIIYAASTFRKKGLDSDDKRIAWDATKEIAKSFGTISANTQSVVHQTFIEHQNNVIIPPIIADLMKKHYGGIIDMEEDDAPAQRQIEENNQ